MRKLPALVWLACLALTGRSQSAHTMIDSFKSQLKKTITPEEKINILGYLSRTMMNSNLAEADKYGRQMIETAEMTRDRKLMIKALLTNGERYSYLAGRKDNIEKSINYYEQGLELARQNKMDEEIVKAYLSLSEVYRYMPDNEKALSYCNQAYSYTGVIKNDSLTARVHLEYGSVFLAKNEKLLSLRNYMTALRMAEELKNNTLLRLAYSRLSLFYADIEDYDKAIDYQTKALNILSKIKTGQTPYNRIQDLARIGDLYAAKKNFDMSMHYYERSLALADSIKYEPIKAITYRSIVNNYLDADQPQKALSYFNEHPQLKNFLQTVNFGHFVDQSYGYIYTRIGNYDSAKYYYNKIAPFFEKDVNSGNQYSYYYQLGKLHRKTGEYDKALVYFTKAQQTAGQIGQLEQMSHVAAQLDSLYRLKGDYKQALYYSSLNYQYKDSLDKLGKEKDLMQIEVADEQQRQERLEKEKLEIKRKRDNIQYLLITIGIAGLFIIMVMMGMFKVSATTIKMIGFFTFLMFFEFIFLILKKNIYGITKGEPWKDLLFMILLAAVLLPLHHWLEHKVIHYLTSHNRLTTSGKGLMDKVLRRKKTPAK
ncbi:MAG: tetratricopeptide repeat protein [Chitinophagaceae bacterium]